MAVEILPNKIFSHLVEENELVAHGSLLGGDNYDSGVFSFCGSLIVNASLLF